MWLVNATVDDADDQCQVSRLLVEADSEEEAVTRISDLGWCVLGLPDGPNPTLEAGMYEIPYELGQMNADETKTLAAVEEAVLADELSSFDLPFDDYLSLCERARNKMGDSRLAIKLGERRPRNTDA